MEPKSPYPEYPLSLGQHVAFNHRCITNPESPASFPKPDIITDVISFFDIYSNRNPRNFSIEAKGNETTP